MRAGGCRLAVARIGYDLSVAMDLFRRRVYLLLGVDVEREVSEPDGVVLVLLGLVVVLLPLLPDVSVDDDPEVVLGLDVPVLVLSLDELPEELGVVLPVPDVPEVVLLSLLGS